MCTATFIKDQNGRLIFTTNRDEHAARPTEAPKIHKIQNQTILFPKDLQAGGSWVGVSENALLCCLMNGAEGEHEWLGTTAPKSRGQVLLESFQYQNAAQFLEEGLFEDTHPFTLLHLNIREQTIHAIKWNGSKKWMESFDINTPHIWSAYTLYPEEQRMARAALFEEWSKDASHLNAKEIFKLHRSTKTENGLRLTDSDAVNTVSVTQLVVSDTRCDVMYYLVNDGEGVRSEIGF